MNPGPVEEAGKVANTTVQGLSSQPMLLALVVLQIIVICTVGYLAYSRNKYETSVNETLVNMCKEAMQKRSDTPPPPLPQPPG